MRDRVEVDTFPMTHEFLAYMLGVQRPGVTVAAQALQRAGRVRYARGRLTILDGDGLEADACECHRVLKGAACAAPGISLPAIFRSQKSFVQNRTADTSAQLERQRKVSTLP